MGWQRCGSVHKKYDTYKHAESRGETPKPHPCPKNYEGSSRAMEADAALLLTIDMYNNTEVTIENIVANDNSSMKVCVCVLFI
eukprot:11086610-Ditylum_brightwellii.AAC.1